MVYNIFIGEPKGLSAVEALERAKTDAMNQNQTGFINSVIQNAVNSSLGSFKLF